MFSPVVTCIRTSPRTHFLMLSCFREKLHEAHSDLQKKKEVIDDLEPKADGSSKPFPPLSATLWVSVYNRGFLHVSVAKKIDELQEILRKKDEDMKQMEERYKRYMEKARTVSPQCCSFMLVSF